MATIREQIIERALELLRSHPDGIRYAELVRKVGRVKHIIQNQFYYRECMGLTHSLT